MTYFLLCNSHQSKKVPSCLMVLCRLLRLFLLCLIPLSDILQFGHGSMLESLPELELEGPLSPQPGVGGELGSLHWAQSKTRTLVASYSSRWQSWSPSTGWETCSRGSWGAQFSVLKHLWYSVTSLSSRVNGGVVLHGITFGGCSLIERNEFLYELWTCFFSLSANKVPSDPSIL